MSYLSAVRVALPLLVAQARGCSGTYIWPKRPSTKFTGLAGIRKTYEYRRAKYPEVDIALSAGGREGAPSNQMKALKAAQHSERSPPPLNGSIDSPSVESAEAQGQEKTRDLNIAATGGMGFN